MHASRQLQVRAVLGFGTKLTCKFGRTDISDECVGVQLNAPATEGRANEELLEYICQVRNIVKIFKRIPTDVSCRFWLYERARYLLLPEPSHEPRRL